MDDGVKLYRILVISFTVILLVVGIYVGFKIDEKENEIAKEVLKNIENPKIEEKQDTNIYNDNKSKLVDVELVYEDKYSLCEESVVTLKIVHNTTVEDVKDEEITKQKKEKTVYEIKEETNKKLVFKKVHNGYCPDNYMIILEDEKVNIYRLIDEKNKELVEETDIEESWIRDELKENLKKGVVVSSKEELNRLIEDLES